MTAPTISLVTGSNGSAHVTSANAGNLNAGIFGTGSYILNVGGKLACTLGTNEVSVAAGSAVHNGRQIDVEVGGSVAFASGTAGKYRHDLVVLRYAKSGSVESASIVCIQGTEASSAVAATDPSYNTGSILDGAAASDMVLCRVVLAEMTATLEQVAKASVQNAAVVEITEIVNSDGWLGYRRSDGTIELWAEADAEYANEKVLTLTKSFPANVELSSTRFATATLGDLIGNASQGLTANAKIDVTASNVTVAVHSGQSVWSSGDTEPVYVHVFGIEA